jgi:hypothetical protein
VAKGDVFPVELNTLQCLDGSTIQWRTAVFNHVSLRNGKVFGGWVSIWNFNECCSGGRALRGSGGRRGSGGLPIKRGDVAYTAVTRLGGSLSVPCVSNGSIPNNLTRIGAEILRDVVTKAKLGIENKETGGKSCIALVNEPGEEDVGLFVDGVPLGLKYHLDCTTKDRESKVDDGNS